MEQSLNETDAGEVAADRDNTPDNTDNTGELIPFKELQTQLNTAPIRAWRAFVRLRKLGNFEHGADWKHKQYTDKQNHFVNPGRYLEQVKTLKPYADIGLKLNHSLSLITPVITDEAPQQKQESNQSDNTDNKTESETVITDNKFLDKYIAQLEEENERLITEKDKVDVRWDKRYGEMEERFARLFDAYNKANEDRQGLLARVHQLQLESGQSDRGGVRGKRLKVESEDDAGQPEQQPEGEVEGETQPSTPPGSPQIQPHGDFIPPEETSPSSEFPARSG